MANNECKHAGFLGISILLRTIQSSQFIIFGSSRFGARCGCHWPAVANRKFRYSYANVSKCKILALSCIEWHRAPEFEADGSNEACQYHVRIWHIYYITGFWHHQNHSWSPWDQACLVIAIYPSLSWHCMLQRNRFTSSPDGRLTTTIG